MGFTIKCNQCGAEIELHRNGENTEEIYSHSNGIACDCGNKIYNNLTKEYWLLIIQCHPGTRSILSDLKISDTT